VSYTVAGRANPPKFILLAAFQRTKRKRLVRHSKQPSSTNCSLFLQSKQKCAFAAISQRRF
jgi:GTP-binding protein EngB required for normal cell division